MKGKNGKTVYNVTEGGKEALRELGFTEKEKINKSDILAIIALIVSLIALAKMV